MNPIQLSFLDASIVHRGVDRRTFGVTRREVWNKTNGVCAYCRSALGSLFHCDHVVPLSKGGTSAVGNLLPSCPGCNVWKSDKSPSEWRRFIERQKELNQLYEQGDIPPLTLPLLCQEQGIGLSCVCRILGLIRSLVEPFYKGQETTPPLMFLAVLNTLDVPFHLNKRYWEARNKALAEIELLGRIAA